MLRGFSLTGGAPAHLGKCDCCARGPNIFSLHEAAVLRARMRAKSERASAAAPIAAPEKGIPHDLQIPQTSTSAAHSNPENAGRPS